MGKWNKNKIVADAYALRRRQARYLKKAHNRLVNENNDLRGQLVAHETTNALSRTILGSQMREVRDALPGETCDLCGKVHKGGMKFDTPPPKEGAPQRPVAVNELFERISIQEKQIAELRSKLDKAEIAKAQLESRETSLKRQIDNMLTDAPRVAGLRQTYQGEVRTEVERLWGARAMASQRERGLRFFEEASELAQAVGLRHMEMVDVVAHVFSRKIGGVEQEVGGVMVTLAALCDAMPVSMTKCAHNELERLRHKEPEEMRQRHNAKPAAIRDVTA